MVIKRLAFTVATAAALVLGAAVVPASADTEPTTPGGVSFPVLQQGAKGENVRALQWLLNCKGYPVAAPGHYGPKTAMTVKNLQLKSGVRPADGVTGALTWSQLVQGSTKYGARNDCVKALQVLLNSYREDSKSDDLPITGYFGPKTRTSLHNYEDWRGLPPIDTAELNVWNSLLTSYTIAD
jgi:peptidoglycan hydrolase-like protein with peptidoglycan-binding domain